MAASNGSALHDGAAGSPKPRRPPGAHPALRRLGRAALAVLGTLLVAELAVRIATGTLLRWNSPEDRDAYGVNDPLVGRILKPGVSFRHPKGFTITTGDRGTRDNGAAAPPAERPLTLAVGDSFAFGDQVDDADTWPAVLERLTGRRVINAGVPGFGLDQAVLRAEQLAPAYAPDTIVVSFIPHDVIRCEMSYWSSHAKPYFDVDAAGLHLHPAPVPPSGGVPWKRFLSKSVIIDRLFTQSLHWDGPDTVVHHRGREVACLLMTRLAALARERGARVVVVAQPQEPNARAEHLEIKDGVLGCAARSRVPTLDLFPVIERLPPGEREKLFHGHMTAAGNHLVATELAARLAGGAAAP